MGRKPVFTKIPERIRPDDILADEPDVWEPHRGESEGDVEEDSTAYDPVFWPDDEDEFAYDVDHSDRPVVLPRGDPSRLSTSDHAVLPQTGMHRSLDVLINTIPGEVLVLWAALDGAAELYDLPMWAMAVFLVLAVLATPVYVYRSIDSAHEAIEPRVTWWQESNVRWQSVSATGAFLVWVYYLGGPFHAAGLQDPALATVLVIIYPLLIVISPYYGSLVLYQLSRPNIAAR